MDYIEINKKAYNMLAREYDERNHEISQEFWFNIYDDLNLKNRTNAKILEVGPGNGRNIRIFRDYNDKFDISAIELSEKLCEIIHKNNPSVRIINKNILDCDLGDEKYDIIQMIAVIHLFPIEDAKKVLRRIRELLKDDGFLIIGTTMNEIESEGYYIKEDYNIKVKRFRHKYTKESYERLLRECGFEVYKPYFVSEIGRNKLWYDAVVRKSSKS